MKKILFSLFGAVALVFAMSSCSGCSKSQEVPEDSKETSSLATEAPGKLNVEHVVATDRQQMYMQYKEDYRWFETCVVLKEYLDAEETSSEVSAVSNIFMYLDNVKEQSADSYVVLFSHTPDTAAVEIKPNAFWVGDMLLNEADIKLTFEQAYDKLMQANLPKPHSRQCVLRRELGPKVANAQYIFGNRKDHVYVDAVTGDVRTKNPVYEGFELNMPLGEWP